MLEVFEDESITARNAKEEAKLIQWKASGNVQKLDEFMNRIRGMTTRPDQQEFQRLSKKRDELAEGNRDVINRIDNFRNRFSAASEINRLYDSYGLGQLREKTATRNENFRSEIKTKLD